MIAFPEQLASANNCCFVIQMVSIMLCYYLKIAISLTTSVNMPTELCQVVLSYMTRQIIMDTRQSHNIMFVCVYTQHEARAAMLDVRAVREAERGNYGNAAFLAVRSRSINTRTSRI